MAGYTAMEWIDKEQTDRSREMAKYISETKRALRKFGVELDAAITKKLNSLKTTIQVDNYVEKVKKDYLKKYIKEKIRILKDFSIKVTDDHIEHMKTLTSPIYIDNYAQDLIRKIQK